MRMLTVLLLGALCGMAGGEPLAGAWRFDNGGEFPGAAGAVSAEKDGGFALRYDFTGGGRYVAAYCDFPQPRVVGSVQFAVKKPACAQLTIRITDDTGQTFQKSVSFDSADWSALSFDMRGWASHWGGANDGSVHQPLHNVGLLVEETGLRRPRGTILSKDWRITEAAATTSGGGTLHGEYVATRFKAEEGWSGSGGAARHASLSLFGKPDTLLLRVRGAVKGPQVRIVLGSHFHQYERVAGVLDGGEQVFEIPSPPEGWTQSGAAEKDVDYPLRLQAVTAEAVDASGTAPLVEFVDLRCRTTLPAERAVTVLPRIVETEADPSGRELAIPCTVWNLHDREWDAQAVARIRNWEGAVIDTDTVEVKLPARGEPVTIELESDIPFTTAFAEIEVEITAPDMPPARGYATYTRPLEGGGDTTLRPELPWGMGVYLYRYGSAEAMDQIAAQAQAAGVKWTREEFSWASMEPTRGQIDFSYYDNVVDTARRHGISVYGLLSYWSNWTKAYTPEGIDDFCRWTAATVAHFKDRVKHWEIYNEPNIFFWDGPKELYPELVKKAYATIKSVDPEAQVLAISTAGIDREFIDLCLDAGAPFDILTIHPYRGRLVDRAFVKELKDVAAQVGNRPVWITEMGWSTQVGSVDEKSQAQLLARCYLAAVGSGTVQSMGWYDFRNDGNDPFYNEENFGVLRQDYSPKPAYRALAAICRTFDKGAPTLEEVENLFIFRMGDAAAVWSPREVQVSFKAAAGVRVSNLMGEDITAAKEGLLTIPPNSPVLFKGDQPRFRVKAARKEASIISF